MDADFLLVRRMKQGDDGAFDTFVRKYYGEVLKYCRFHCFDALSAEDLTQETFLKFFANLPGKRRISSIRSPGICAGISIRRKGMCPWSGRSLNRMPPLLWIP